MEVSGICFVVCYFDYLFCLFIRLLESLFNCSFDFDCCSLCLLTYYINDHHLTISYQATTKDSDGSVDSSLGKESVAATSSRPGHSIKEGEGGGETPTSSTTTALARMQNEISDLRNEHHREVSTLRLGLNNTNQDVSILKRNCKKNSLRLDDIERSRWTENEVRDILNHDVWLRRVSYIDS